MLFAMKEYSYEDYKKPIFQNKKLYKSLISNFYRNSALVIMIYSIVDKNSVENTEKMVESIKEFSKSWY